MVFVGIALWGLHMGLSQGVLASMITDRVPAEYRGTAFGVFNLASGLALLIASGGAGLLWDQLSPAATFWAGASIALVGTVACMSMRDATAGAPATAG